MFRLHTADPSQTIILAGSGRSGTTWLGNIIAANPNVRIIFEPFDYRHVPQAGCLPLRPYARLNESYPEWEPFVRQVLQGRIENEWINRQGKRWWAWRRLIKEIRANLMLAWIDRMFHPRIVFTIRHPCAVVLSRLKLKWETHLDVFLAQPQLIADYLEPFLDLVHSAHTEVQKQAVMWSVENLIPLQQLPDHNWVFCLYEDFCRQPEAEADRVLKGLGIRKTWLTQRAIRGITMVTRPDSAVLTKKDPLTEWQHQLSPADIDTVLETVHAFGINLYSSQPLPVTNEQVSGVPLSE